MDSFNPDQYIANNTEAASPAFNPDQYISENSDVSPIAAVGRGLESTVQPIYTGAASVIDKEPFSQESKEQEALKNAAWDQQPFAYGAGKTAGITGEAALAPEALEGNIAGDFATNASISALGADWSDPKNAAIETTFGGGLGAGIGAAGRGIADKIVSDGSPAGAKAVARLFGIKDTDAADFAEKFGGSRARVPGVTNQNALEKMGQSLQDFSEDATGDRVPWSLDKGATLDAVDKAIKESSDTMNNYVSEAMERPDVQKITTPVAKLSKNITDTDYYKLAPQNAASSPLLKLTNLIDNIPELKGKTSLTLDDLALLRTKLYSLGDSAWDKKSLNIMKNTVDRESMEMLEKIGNSVPELNGLKQAVNDEAARYNVLNTVKDKLPTASQPDYTGMSAAGGTGIAAKAAGAPFYISMLPLMLMRSELRRNLAPLLGTSAGKAAEAVMSNPTWMKLLSGAVKKFGPQAGVAAVHKLLSQSDPDYADATQPHMSKGGRIPDEVRAYAEK